VSAEAAGKEKAEAANPSDNDAPKPLTMRLEIRWSNGMIMPICDSCGSRIQPVDEERTDDDDDDDYLD